MTGFNQFNGDRLPPVFFSDEAQGYYVFTNQEMIADGYQRPDLFSSTAMIPIEPDPPYNWIPEMLDPPDHTKWRRLLGPLFTPARAKAMTDDVRTLAVSLIENLAERDDCEFVKEFAKQFPTTIFLNLMGLPQTDLDMFLRWEYLILHGNDETDPTREKAMAAMGEVAQYFSAAIATARGDDHADKTDVISQAVRWEIDGAPIPEQDLLSLCILLLIAGLDTVAAQLSYAFYTLAKRPDLRQRIVDEPAIVPRAVEEFLRVHSIVQPGRKVTRDVEFHGCPLKAGDMVLLPLAAAGRDDSQYERASEVDFDRPAFRHIAFGAGPHRCLGSHLARIELAVALEEWHRRIPEYQIFDEDSIVEHHSGVYGLNSLPLTWAT
ncbi:cytochrome P450 [Mycobacterium sp. 236(2023)]|uniref:cytochrome P450 n=1 Tax=Mycobacterium sp. 236(2023) TaxID=3038163 RepID=UPI00241561C2|nr:cytochrome P450 [Mycobacterium sp. 236(2023)]MDG4668085.1 cytochrome P450 [Mycobacterium sp. 236(2023)]